MRKQRQSSKLGIYHIVMRGINKENIFEDNDDKNRFIQTLYRFCEKLEIGLISYKLMNNHVHFQVKTAEDRAVDVCSDLVKRICTSYVQHYYNPKYERVGSLFQSRYNSRAVEDEEDVMNVCRYILQNAMKQGEQNDPFAFSSYEENLLVIDKKCFNRAINKDILPSITDRENFIKLVNDRSKFMLMDEDYRLQDDDIKKFICEALGIEHANMIEKSAVDVASRDQVIKELYKNGAYLKTLERITHISKRRLKKIINVEVV